MASIHAEKRNGRTYYRLYFRDKDRKPHHIRLGDANKKDANAIKVKVENLVSASIAGTSPDSATTKWLTKIGDDLAEKLAKAGLIPPRKTNTLSLSQFIDSYIKGRKDMAENTTRNFKNSRDKLVNYFGENRCLHEVTPGDADDWRQDMANRGYSSATICTAVKHAKRFFKHAVRKKFLKTNPFDDLVAGSDKNSDRLYFVDQKTIDRVIDAATDTEWKLIIALARYGGLRTPSEILPLTWHDVNWDRQSLTVTSPKTKRHGKGSRVVPIFPELRPYLQNAFEHAAEGDLYVITRYRDTNTNLRTQFLRIIKSAGVQPWPRLFQNLRASRETELSKDFPIADVTAWIGNSPEVADKHYLMATEESFQRAISGGGTGGNFSVEKGVATQDSALSVTINQSDNSHSKNREETIVDALCRLMVMSDVTPSRGVERIKKYGEKTHCS